jgi:hypothetical protein
MLVKSVLEKQIETAIYKAMKDAFNDMNTQLNNAKNLGDGSEFNPDSAIEAFANAASKCSSDIASAIDTYIKSAQIMIPIGTVMTPMPTLVTAAGPVTGVFTLAAPTTLLNSIS